MNQSHVWKRTSNGFFSTASSGTSEATTPWSGGIDANNNAVMNTIATIGITFDWAKGGTLTLGGSNNINGELVVKNAYNQEIGRWDKDGISITQGIISGPTITGGTISGTTISGGSISGGSISGTSISGGSISGTSVSGGTVQGTNIYGSYIEGAEISGGEINGSYIEGGEIVGATFRSRDYGVRFELINDRITGYNYGNQVGYLDWGGYANGHNCLGIGGEGINIWTDHIYFNANEGITRSNIQVMIDTNQYYDYFGYFTFYKGLCTNYWD